MFMLFISFEFFSGFMFRLSESTSFEFISGVLVTFSTSFMELNNAVERS